MPYSPPFSTTYSSQMLAAMDLRQHTPIRFAHFDWPGGEVRLHDHLGVVTLSGQNFDGIGRLGSVSYAESTDADGVQECSVSLLGIPAAAMSGLIGAAALVGVRAALAWGLVGSDGAVIPTPVFAFAGFIDARKWTLSANDDGTRSLEMTLTLTTGETPGHRISQRRKASDGSGWRHLAAMANDPPQWPA